MAETITTADILRKVRSIEIRTRRLVTEAVSGAYHSSFRGQGVDFDEVREYSPGDDVRSIDWNVTARMDRPFVKVFREERELSILILLDLSASGVFGSSDLSKREQAAEIAAVLALSATRNQDKAGLLLYTDRVEQFIPPKKGRQHNLRLIREALFFQPEGSGTDTQVAIRYLRQVQRRKAVVFLISDFLEESSGRLPGETGHPDHPLFDSLSLLNRHHDLICIRVQDPREWELPAVGTVVLEDAETGDTVEIDTSDATRREKYRRRNRERMQAWDRRMRTAGIDSITVTTNNPYLGALRALFERRSRRH